MTHALFLFSLSPLEIVGGGGGERGGEPLVGRVRGCIVFNYKEWVIQKGVVESEKTEKKKASERM